jgi:hypothetical protein
MHPNSLGSYGLQHYQQLCRIAGNLNLSAVASESFDLGIYTRRKVELH